MAETRLKELKVTLPMDLYLMVVRLKLTTGQTIADTMEQALRAHFLAMEREGRMPSALLDPALHEDSSPA